MYTLSDHLEQSSTIMKATFLDLRKRSKEIVKALDRNEPVTLFYRGKAKGVIVPASAPRENMISASKHKAFGMWQERADMRIVQNVVARLRRPRHVL
jgi:hypothetical protein